MNIVGLFIADVNGDGNFELVAIGKKESPTVVFTWNPRTNELDTVTTATVKPFADIRHNAGGVVADVNGDGVEELLFLGDRAYVEHDTYYTYDAATHVWRPHKIRYDSASPLDKAAQGAAATAVPGGFLIGRHGAGPMLLQWDGRRLRPNPGAITAPALSTFDTNSIVNFAGLIPGSGIGVLVANGAVHVLGEGASNRQQMNIQYGSIQHYPTPESRETMNARSICFVNVDSKKRIWGILYANWGQTNVLHLYRGDSYIGRREIGGMSTNCAVVADFDNDGHDEIFLLSGIDDNVMYRVYSADRIEEIYSGQALNAFSFWGGNGSRSRMVTWGHTCVTADLDKDGYQELYVAIGELNVNPGRYYKVSDINRNPTYNYVRIYPKTAAGAPARGAIVTLKQGDRTWKRIIDNGGNRSGQSEPIAHFGLGANREPVEVTIEWPTGGRVRHANIPFNTVIVIQHTFFGT